MAAPNESTPVLDGSPSRSPRSTPASPGGAGGITFGSLLGHSFVDPWGAIAQVSSDPDSPPPLGVVEVPPPGREKSADSDRDS